MKPKVHPSVQAQEASLPTVNEQRRDSHWEPWEKELASDYSKSAIEVARITGRSYYAVVGVRRRLKGGKW